MCCPPQQKKYRKSQENKVNDEQTARSLTEEEGLKCLDFFNLVRTGESMSSKV